ncbi:unnamed protein product, partial [Pelagomonas calceolata]
AGRREHKGCPPRSPRAKRRTRRSSAWRRPPSSCVGRRRLWGLAAACRENRQQERVARRHKMPAREPIRMRRAKAWNVEVENAYRFQCAGWRSAEEYAQGEYGDEISWFSDSGLVEKVQNRQGLFMYFKRCLAASAALPSSSMASSAAWGLARSRGRGPRETRRAQAPRVPRQVPAARQDLRVRERRRPQVEDHDPVDFRTHERKTKTSFRSSYW